MKNELSVNHLLGIKNLSKEDIELLLDTAIQFKDVINRPIKKVPSLRDITIANVFFENSTRTKLSFELAEKRLSADVLNFSSSGSSIAKGETLLDTLKNIIAMKVDMIVIRHPQVGAAHFLSDNTNATIINAGDGTHEHPTQALLDAFSLQERFNDLQGLKVCILGDIKHSRVALSNIFCLKKMGAEILLCGPSTLIQNGIEKLGVRVTYKIDEALQWADAVNVLRIQHERMDTGYIPSLQEFRLLYGLTKERIENLNKPLTILHPGPINRGVEIDSSVADSENAIILNQVENGVAIRMSVLYHLASKASIKL
jgi:aspartate carbamoyltransferase catalytic subunit